VDELKILNSKEVTRKAWFYERLLAYSVDSIIFLIVIGLPMVFLQKKFNLSLDLNSYFKFYEATELPKKISFNSVLFYLFHTSLEVVITSTLSIGTVFGILWCYFFYNKYQSTPGKMMFSLKVIDLKNGQKLTRLSRVAQREFLSYLVCFPIWLGYFLALGENKMTLYDHLAQTRVVKVLH